MSLKYDGKIAEKLTGNEYINTEPRRWTQEEEDWIFEQRDNGYTIPEIAIALNRSDISVRMKFKKLKKTSHYNTYNERHREEKYQSNDIFLQSLGSVKSILDVYCGVSSFWKNNYPNIAVTTNDKNTSFTADYHMDSLKLLCMLYYHNKTYDVIDLDPFGSAYDCLDLSIKMSTKGIIVTFGEMGLKRWRRYDFVSKRYNIYNNEDFVIDNLITEVVKIGKRNKKTLTPIIIKNWAKVSRVYFRIDDYKEVSQWEV